MRWLVLLIIGIALMAISALMAKAAAPQPPQRVVIIACRVDDLTGQAGRQDTDLAAKGWRDLIWHFTNGNELECKREEVPLTDAVTLKAPDIQELHPDFSSFAQCAAIGMQYAPAYEKAHQGWGVMAVGCPIKVTSGGPDGPVIGWSMPTCPTSIGDLTITCKFDGSLI